MLDIEDTMLSSLKTADYEGFIKLGAQFADVVSVAEDNKNWRRPFGWRTKVETIEKKLYVHPIVLQSIQSLRLIVGSVWTYWFLGSCQDDFSTIGF